MNTRRGALSNGYEYWAVKYPAGNFFCWDDSMWDWVKVNPLALTLLKVINSNSELNQESFILKCCLYHVVLKISLLIKKKTRKHLSKPILQSSHLFVLKSLRPTFLWFHKFPQLQSFCHKEARRGSLGWKQKQQFFVKNFGEKLPVFCTCVYVECAHFM